MYYWAKITDSGAEKGTDLLMYRERSGLLIPDRHEENRFVVLSEKDSTRFLIGSTSEGQLKLMASFFERIYSSSVVKCDPPNGFVEGRILINTRRNRKKTDFYYPSFIRSIINIPSMVPGIQMRYETIIRSSLSILGRRRYTFAILIGYTGNAESLKVVENTVRDEVTRLRKRFRWKFVIKKKNSRLRSYNMKDPFSLSSFLRIPSDEPMV